MPIINAGKHGKYTLKENKKLFFYPQEWVKIMESVKPKQRETLMMLINTGARINEARHIKVKDVDYERNSLILMVTKVRARLKETRPTPRHIPISSKFTKFLKKQVKKYGLQSEDYFPMRKPNGVAICIKKAANKAGRADFRDFSPHNVRKTFECWLIAIGIDGFKVAKHLGHTPQVAMKDYISADIFRYKDKVLIRDLLGDLYSYNEGRRF